MTDMNESHVFFKYECTHKKHAFIIFQIFSKYEVLYEDK